MDRLAKQQACQLFIEQEIEKGLKAGETKPQIGRRLAEWIEKLFEAKVQPRTIEQRARRLEAVATNVASDSTPQEQREKEENQVSHGGAREGAGRSPRISCNSDDDESVNLFSLKLYWRRANKRDRKAFLEWAENN